MHRQDRDPSDDSLEKVIDSFLTGMDNEKIVLNAIDSMQLNIRRHDAAEAMLSLDLLLKKLFPFTTQDKNESIILIFFKEIFHILQRHAYDIEELEYFNKVFSVAFREKIEKFINDTNLQESISSSNSSTSSGSSSPSIEITSQSSSDSRSGSPSTSSSSDDGSLFSEEQEQKHHVEAEAEDHTRLALQTAILRVAAQAVQEENARKEKESQAAVTKLHRGLLAGIASECIDAIAILENNQYRGPLGLGRSAIAWGIAYSLGVNPELATSLASYFDNQTTDDEKQSILKADPCPIQKNNESTNSNEKASFSKRIKLAGKAFINWVKSFIPNAFRYNPSENPHDEQGLSQAIKDNNISLAEKLLTRGVNPNLQNGDGFSLLHLAARYDRPEIAYALIDHGAEIDAKIISTGDTPLHLAVKEKKHRMVRVLLNKGADTNAKNAEEKTPCAYGVDDTYKKVRNEFPDAYAKGQPKNYKTYYLIRKIAHDQAFLEEKTHYSLTDKIPKFAQLLQTFFAKREDNITPENELEAISSMAKKHAKRTKWNPFFTLFNFRDPMMANFIILCMSIKEETNVSHFMEFKEVQEHYNNYLQRRARGG